MDQQIVDNARLGVWLLNDQTGPEAVPDAARLALALNKLVAFGKAINAEGLSTDAAIELLKRAFSAQQ